MTCSRSVPILAGAAAILLATVVLAGCGSGANTAAHAAAAKTASGLPATVAVAKNSKLGKILVDSEGHTLYLFQKDTGTSSSCTGPCAAAWPPLRSSGDPVVLGGATTSLVGTTARSDGKAQATYDGHPLYSFVRDTKPGATNGEGLTAFGGTWFAVSPTGNPIRPQAPAAPMPGPKRQPQLNPIPQGDGGDHDSDNNGGPDDGDGGI